MSDTTQTGLAKELFTVILGLEPKVADRVMRSIQRSEDIADMKNNQIRVRIGSRALRFIRQAIEIARAEGTEKHEHGTEDEPDEDKKMTAELEDKSKLKKADKKKADKKEDKKDVKESFASFLMNEVTVDVDVDDPAAATQEIKKAARMGKERTQRQQRIDARKEQRDASQSTEPTAALDKQIAQTKERLITLQQRRDRMAGGK